MSDSVRPHRRQPTRLPRPWDSPGKNTGVGCHFLLQCIKVKSESEVTQSCPTLCNPIDGSSPGSPVPGILLQARILEWVAISFSMHESEKRKSSRSVVSNPQRSHGLQPSRLLRPWDFPGKSTGVGCHCLLQDSLKEGAPSFRLAKEEVTWDLDFTSLGRYTSCLLNQEGKSHDNQRCS